MSELEEQIISVLRNQPNHLIEGEIHIANTEPDDVLDAIFLLKDKGIVEGAFQNNPNRRQGSDFGWLKLRGR